MDKYSAQLDEIKLTLLELKAIMSKQSQDELIKRLEKLEVSVKTQHVKLDALSSLDLPTTINVPVAPTSVRVAGGSTAGVEKEPRAANVAADDSTTGSAPKSFASVVEFFKHMWMTDTAKLLERNVLTQEYIENIMTENKEALDKKSKNDIVLQKAIASALYKKLTPGAKEIVKSIQVEYTSNLNKANAKEIVLDLE